MGQRDKEKYRREEFSQKLWVGEVKESNSLKSCVRVGDGSLDNFDV